MLMLLTIIKTRISKNETSKQPASKKLKVNLKRPQDYKFYKQLESHCKKLALSDTIPNESDKDVSLREVLEMASTDEGYVVYIEGHRSNLEGEDEYCVKWIGFPKTTWEKEIPEDDIFYYRASLSK
uniref:Chromo domain-containing protein n=1 Tax=Clytia hemisphaerica TaxID=252671 RepID=A0A7M5UEP1_9CNID